MTGRVARVALGVVLGLELLAYVFFLHRGGVIAHHTLWLQSLALSLYLAALVLLPRARLAPRHAVYVVLVVGAALQLVALSQIPESSDDDYRYAWDAKVQLAGIDPYRYAPDASHLAGLRDSFLFPNRVPCHWPLSDGACSAINRPTVHTVYPPVAQLAFAVIRLGSFGGHGNHLPLQLAAALGALAVSLLLARRARTGERPAWTVAVWAWCPVVVLELGNGAHIDWLAVLLVVLALMAGGARRPGIAGVLAGAAVAAKFYPALILPALVRRRPVLVVGAAIATVAVAYLPHVAAVGTDVIGFIPGYLQEESYSSGARFLLIGAVLPSGVATVVAAAVLVFTAWWVARHVDPDAPEHGAVVMVGVALLVSTPQYGWYSLMLLALTAMTGAVEWLPVVIAPTFFYLLQGDFGLSVTLGRALYGAALAIVLIIWWIRRARTGQDDVTPSVRPGDPLPSTT